jgi:hypothetical protein
MSTPNFIAITAATCPAASKPAALQEMSQFAQDCRENGAVRVTYGSVISGRYPGALVFVQFFDDLHGFEGVMDMIPQSSAYLRMVNDHAVTPFSRNVFRGKPIEFEPKLEPTPKYLMLTRAHRRSLEEATMLDLLNKTAPVFKSSGAQTMRMGQAFTGSDLGSYMLGVTYPDMSAIERTYDALAVSPEFGQLMNGLEIDMRSITKIAGIL